MDIGHSDNKPGNSNTNEFASLFEWLGRLTGLPEWFWWLLAAIIPLVIILPILCVFFPIVRNVLKSMFWGLWWLICLPFKLIAKLIEYIKDKKGGG